MTAHRRFLSPERGAVSTDWVILSAVMLVTAFAVVTAADEGLMPGASLEGVRGAVLREAYGDPACPGGLGGLQRREDDRVARGGADPVAVAEWLGAEAAVLSDDAVRARREALRGVTEGQGGWTRDHTLRDAYGCEMMLRGLI